MLLRFLSDSRVRATQRVLITACVLGFLSGCGKPVTEDECLKLLDKYTDKLIDQARPSTSAAERAELQQEARKKAELDPAFAECTSEVSRNEFDCAMKANNADEIERCLM